MVTPTAPLRHTERLRAVGELHKGRYILQCVSRQGLTDREQEKLNRATKLVNQILASIVKMPPEFRRFRKSNAAP